MKIIFLALVGILCTKSLLVKAQSKETKIENLVAFAKLTGDIRYFSPTDIVHQQLLNVGWDRISVNGTLMALNTLDQRSFADSLISIFKPVEPSLFLAYNGNVLTRAPEMEEKDLMVSVQHRGLELYGGTNYGGAFQSIRLNRRSLLQDGKMSSANFVNKIIPKKYLGKEFELKIQYDLQEKVSLLVSNEKGKILSDEKLTGKGYFLIKDTLSETNLLMNIELRYDEILGHFFLDSIMSVGNDLINISTLVNNQASPDPCYNVYMRTTDKELYPEKNTIGDTLLIKLSEALSASFPLTVYATEEETYPKSNFNDSTYRYNKGGFERYFDSKLLKNMHVRLSNIIHIWNVFRYAYVYNTLTDSQQEELLRVTLSEVLETKNVQEYYEVVWSMLAAYQDAHIFFSMEEVDAKQSNSAPLSVIQIKGKYYVRNIHQDSLQNIINIGDEILELDHVNINKVAQNKGKFASGSAGNINRAVIFNLLYGEKDSKVILKLRDSRTHEIKEIALVRDFKFPTYGTLSTLKNKNNRMLNDNTYYFNLSESAITDTLLSYIKDSSKNIVFDVRGYLTLDFEVEEMLNKLISDTIEHSIFCSYEILSPKRKSFKQETQVSLPENLFKKANFYFLVDNTTQSAPETFLDIVKHWNIGKIIGQPTAGANGNINYLPLPGNMAVTFSGIKTLNSDGSKHHLIGIIPDYEVDFTLEDIKLERDPYILKALALIDEFNDVQDH